MSYLICKKCGRCYQLEGDESPEDFELCHCGGDLKHIQYLPNDEDILSEEAGYIEICPFCGGETHLESKECVFCGQRLDISLKSEKKLI